MRITTRKGTALLAYCANVHPGDGLADVLDSVSRYAAAVRRDLGVAQMGLGLWLSRRTLTELRGGGADRLQDALAAAGLLVFTLNGFPYGNFQSEVVKRDVYRPNLTTDERRVYLAELAETLAVLMPPDAAEGTISTLPLGHRAEVDKNGVVSAAFQLGQLAIDLARLRDWTGRQVRVCLEPEPGCVLETAAEAATFFMETLPRAGVPRDVIDAHLGVSYDTCHQAVLFEEPWSSLGSLTAAGVRVGKLQLSSALEIGDPSDAAARRALARFDERRFLHQARYRGADGSVAGVDDLGEMDQLPRDQPWRVHFHVPVHRQLVGKLQTTRPFLEAALDVVSEWTTLPHLEVETYTWSVLPVGERPHDDAGLVRGLAAEMRFIQEKLQ
jgi:hypothetical protein